jgi:putative FmdB family regulatory protein
MLRMYDFHCTKCGNDFEKLIDSNLLSTVCPSCTGHANRVTSASSIKVTGLGACDRKMRV